MDLQTTMCIHVIEKQHVSEICKKFVFKKYLKNNCQ